MRYSWLDLIRGLAVIGMIFFHANYLLEHVFFHDVLPLPDTFWYILGKWVALIFIITAWIAIFLSHRKWLSIWKALYRATTLGIIAGLISLTTTLFIPDQKILWWIIHFFAIVAFISPVIFFIKKFILWLGFFIIFFGNNLIALLPKLTILIPIGSTPSWFYSADYFPLIPWIGYYFIGYGIAYYLWNRSVLDIFELRTQPYFKWILFFGRNALLIYIIHVPIIYVLIHLFYKNLFISFY